MKKLVLGLSCSLLLSLSSCIKCDKPPQPKACEANYFEGSVYTHEWTPVCGCDNNTYSNAGHAAAYGITEYTEGECGAK